MSDFDVHVRLLVSLALLLYAENLANNRFQLIVSQFIQCNIIAPADRQKYDRMIALSLRISQSRVIEILLFLFVISIGLWISKQVIPYDVSLWYAMKDNHTLTLTLPGYWYAYVSLPVFQFILLRWYYRLIIWYRLLWKISHLKLQLNSLHPDKSGGIGFLSNNAYGLELFLMAHSFLLAGIILNSILNSDTTVWFFQYEILGWLIILMIIPLIPMLFFLPQLVRIKRDGTNELNVFANNYVNEFSEKWIHPGHGRKEVLLGSPDIQSLADLSNSYNISAQMQFLPIRKSVILFILAFIALPFFPLIFTIIPVSEIFSQIISIIF